MEYLQYSKINKNIIKKAPTNSVFIVTTYLIKPHSETLLKLCIKRIQLFHPECDIIILNDSSSVIINIPITKKPPHTKTTI